jgi:hypothetical protein
MNTRKGTIRSVLSDIAAITLIMATWAGVVMIMWGLSP